MAPTPEELFAAQQAQQKQEQFDRLKRNVAVAGVVICPIIAFLPPRKLDWYTFGLGTAWVLSADHVITVSTGKRSYQHFSFSAPNALPTERAREIQRTLKEKDVVEQGKESLKEGENPKAAGFLKRVWMGGEQEGWKERRLKEERDKLAQGESYQSMILDQIWEVWNWGGNKKNGEGESEKKERGGEEEKK